jgi:hypothetical protein
MPAISCLCRAGKFVPRPEVGDRVVYLARRARYGDEALPHWRLAAVLRLARQFTSHKEAAAWYRERSLPLPANNIVPGNEAAPLDRSHRMSASLASSSARAPRPLRQVALGQGLDAPGDLPHQVRLVTGADGLAEQHVVPPTQLGGGHGRQDGQLFVNADKCLSSLGLRPP